MNIDEFNNKLYEMLSYDSDENVDDVCLITNEPLADDNITLSCGHTFNYKPLFKEISNQKDNNVKLETTRLSFRQIKCPYCRHIQNGLLPTNNKYPLLKKRGVNLPKTLCYKPNKCCYVLTRGINKGNICLKSCIKSYCEKHEGKKSKKQNITLIKCEAMLKYGKRAGEICGCICKTEQSKQEKKCRKHLKQ